MCQKRSRKRCGITWPWTRRSWVSRRVTSSLCWPWRHVIGGSDRLGIGLAGFPRRLFGWVESKSDWLCLVVEFLHTSRIAWPRSSRITPTCHVYRWNCSKPCTFASETWKEALVESLNCVTTIVTSRQFVMAGIKNSSSNPNWARIVNLM